MGSCGRHIIGLAPKNTGTRVPTWRAANLILSNYDKSNMLNSQNH